MEDRKVKVMDSPEDIEPNLDLDLVPNDTSTIVLTEGIVKYSKGGEAWFLMIF